MTNEQRNLVIAGIAIIIIGTGAWYLSKKQPTPTPPSTGEEVSTPTSNEVTQGEGNNQPITPTTTKTLTATEIKAKFTAAMQSAQKAYTNGDYATALNYYNQALKYQKSDVAYSGIFRVYGAEKNWIKALEALNQALALNPKNTDYYIWKIALLDEQTGATFAELKQIYQTGLTKGDPRTKINLVIQFAEVAEANGEVSEAISAWEFAKELNPERASVYQAEIDRLKAL